MQDKEKAGFSQRLRLAMQAKGWEPRPSVLERRFNEAHWGDPITPHGVRKWLLGKALPRQDKLVTLARLLEVDAQTLRFGRATVGEVAEPKARWEESIGWSERELFQAFMKLPVPQRRVIREVIQAFVQTQRTARHEVVGPASISTATGQD